VIIGKYDQISIIGGESGEGDNGRVKAGRKRKERRKIK
jgi:hypothetical protein